MLSSQELASDVLKCKVYDAEYGLDHRAIETSFDVEVPDYAASLGCCLRTLPRMRSKSVLTKRYTID
jgi:hypothetical protein